MLVLLLLGCSDQTPTKFTSTPVVGIETPADGSVFREDDPVAMHGVVTDTEWSTKLDQLTAAWQVNGVSICEEAAFFTAEGTSDCETTFDAGSAVVTLKATDPDGQTGSATATFTINPNDAPTAAISSPEATGAYTSSTPITFEGHVADLQDAADELSVTWSSSLDGAFDFGTTATSDGVTTGSATLSAGSHVITLLVSDTGGRTGQDVVTIDVAAGVPPELTLISPTTGDEYIQGQDIAFTAEVSDDHDAASALTFAWSSSLDGVFSTQGASSGGTAEFTEDGLSIGNHTITVTATDSDGMVATDSATLTVSAGMGPDVSIDLPTPGSETVYGEYIEFSVTVADDRTSPSDLALVWESDVDGVFSTTGANSSGVAGLYYDGLNEGAHIVTVTATDGDGFSGSDTVFLEVTYGEAPEVLITSPSAGTELSRGEGVTFAATVSDDLTPAGDLALSWESDLDGVLDTRDASSAGSASFYTTGLSVGVHVVTLTATDEFGLDTTDTTTVIVDAGDPPDLSIDSPADGDASHVGDPVYFTLSADDDLTAPGSLEIECVSDVDGTLWSGSPDSGGGVSFSVSDLSVGVHNITCTATDEDGQSTSDRVRIEVSVGYAPDVEITAPADGATTTVDEDLTFSATVSDDVTAPTALTVAWESDRDGTLSTARANSSGILSFSTNTLSVGTHHVSLVVTDGDGLSTTDTVTVTVDLGDPPEVEIVLPTVGDVFNEGDIVVFSATVADDRTAASSLALSWSSSLDGVLDTASADSTGIAEFVTGSLRNGTHTVTLTATDGDGYATSDSVSFVVNGIPGAPAVHISPTSPTSDEVLTVVFDAAAVDPDGDTLTYVYSWTRNGSATTYTTTVPASATTRGDVWQVSVYATDGDADGPATTASATIGNSAPSLASVSITPSVAYTDDTLTAVPSGYSDSDGDSAAYAYQWYRGGVAVTGATDATLSGSSFSRDDSITVTAWPTDGTATGSPVTSGARVISNTAPTKPTVLVTPLSPDPGEDLVCGISSASTDADADSISYTYAWTKNGVATGYATNTVPGAATAVGETWTCTVTPTDGTTSGTSATASVVVDDYTAPGAPVLDDLYAWQNETTAVVYGSAEPYAGITLYQTSSLGVSTATATANSAGDFSFSRTLTAGYSYTWYATATDPEGNVSPASNVVDTEVCSPGDAYESTAGYGDACDDAVTEWSTLADDGGTTITLAGNIITDSDEDWYAITTSDAATTGINYYRFHVQMTNGSGDYAFAVYTGGCATSYMDCTSSSSTDPEGSGWTEYEDYAEESGDYSSHATHSDSRVCYDSNGEYNNCDSFATTYYIHVFRKTAVAGCSGYTLSVTNGVW